MNYRAYWVQEHHNATSFAGTTPEVLMADLAARTQRIALGSGGIMLPNYSPLKVAEWGQSLAQLNPGRIEIGLGRATGADPRTSAALLGPGGQNFPAMHLSPKIPETVNALSFGKAAFAQVHKKLKPTGPRVSPTPITFELDMSKDTCVRPLWA